MFVDSEGLSSGLPEIANSLRFNAAASTYASRVTTTQSSAYRKAWHFNLKPSDTTAASIYQCASSGSAGSTARFIIDFSNGRLRVTQYNGSAYDFTVQTDALYRDYAGHYVFDVVMDTSNATTANRIKIYQDNVAKPNLSGSTYPSLNFIPYCCIAGNLERIGVDTYTGAVQKFDGYMSEFVKLDGWSVEPTPSTFAATDVNGQWRTKGKAAIASAVSASGSDSFFLPFDNTTSTTTLGYDASSKGNNFTLTNMVRDGSVNDCSSLDTPTNNWNVWNAVDKLSQVTLANGNIDVSWSGSSGHSVCSTIASSGDKVYYEAVAGGSGSCLGIARQGYNLTWPGNDAYSYGWRGDLGQIMFNGAAPSSAPTFAATNVLMVAIDFAAQKMWCGVNGTWYNSGNPAAGTNPTLSGFASDTWKLAIGQIGTPGTVNTNFGQRPVSGGAFDSASGGYFRYTPPSGFKALCRKNLPDPAIPFPAKHADVALWNGNGGTQNITGLQFQPDFVDAKCRSNAVSWCAVDAVRGASHNLASDLTAAEDAGGNSPSLYGTISAFLSNGFTVLDGSDGTYDGTNGNGKSYSALCLNMGGSTVTNNAGSISSQVRANATAGMSVVTFTAQTSGSGTIGHGLSAAPKLIIVKSRANAYGWTVYHASVGNTGYLNLNTTAATATDANAWNNTSPTSSVFTLGSNFVNTGTWVAYCFTDIPGFLKTGSFSTLGAADNTFVNCGFKPRWVMIKFSNAVNDWFMYDTARDTYNVTKTVVCANSANGEGSFTSGYNIDTVSNGFKVRDAWSANCVFIAIAETPFKFANAR